MSAVQFVALKFNPNAVAEQRIVLDEASGRHAIDVFSYLFYHLYGHTKLPGIPVPT